MSIEHIEHQHETQLKRCSSHMNSNSLLLYPPNPIIFMVKLPCTEVDPTPAGFLSMMYPTWRCKADICTFLMSEQGRYYPAGPANVLHK